MSRVLHRTTVNDEATLLGEQSGRLLVANVIGLTARMDGCFPRTVQGLAAIEERFYVVDDFGVFEATAL